MRSSLRMPAIQQEGICGLGFLSICEVVDRDHWMAISLTLDILILSDRAGLLCVMLDTASTLIW